MGLNVASGKMYPWCDYTWNPLGGKCQHDCKYCYMRRFPVCLLEKYRGKQRLWMKELKTNLHNLTLHRRVTLPFMPEDAVLIFVCSGNDLFTKTTPTGATSTILEKCWEEPTNFYLFQSKNPIRFKEFKDEFPPNSILGTTIETNRADLCREVSNAPSPQLRAKAMVEINWRPGR